MLGSTTTDTMCNMQNTGNIVLIGAGENRLKGPGIGFRLRRNFAGPARLPSCVNSMSCLSLVSRLCVSTNGPGPLCKRRVVGGCHGGMSPRLCPGIG